MRRFARLDLRACAIAVLSLGVGLGNVPAAQEIVFTASEYAFTGPDTIAPGLTTVSLRNDGKEEHHLVLARLDEGRTMADVMAAFQANPAAEPDFITFVGGAGSAFGGETSNATQELAAGNYIMICFIPLPGGQMPHLTMGMVRELVVAGERHEAAAPEVTGEITMNEFSFGLPDTIAAGEHTFRVVNNGEQTHEVALIRLNDGVTAEQFLAALAPGATTPPPGSSVGGNGALSPGIFNFFSADVEAGNYLLLCFVPDTDGAPHIMKGMVKQMVVTAS